MFVPTKTTFGLIVRTATAQEMDTALCKHRWIYLEVNFEDDSSGTPFIYYADSQSEMEQGKVRHDTVEAAANAFAIAVEIVFFV
jgi:hypothetical protein